MKKTNILLIILLVFSTLSISALAQGLRDGTNQQQAISDNLAGGDSLNLSDAEINGLLLMREEEKLAKDVYLELYDEWNTPIFNNIAKSEETHTNAVKRVLEAYGITDPVVSDIRGDFANQELQNLYDALVLKGKESLLDAFLVGATVEDLDIKDLNELLAETTNEDIIVVYENLRKGSRNHLRSFSKQIENNNGVYEAQYISSAELNSIVSSTQERGPLLDDNSNIISGFESQLRRQRGTGIANGDGSGVKQGTGDGNQVRQGTSMGATDGARRGLSDGNYQNSNGKQFGITEQNNRRMMQSNGVSADCLLCDNLEQDGNRFNARLSNGNNAEIKIMPDTASKTALQRLRLRNCDGDCSIELKEVTIKNQARAAYELKTQRNSKLFGIFNKNMNVNAQIDAETGEVLDVNKPWWAFLASEKEE